MSEKQIDEVSGVETTGHEWDGIRELNNPMPRWWLWTFYLCIIWAAGYAIAYPAIPLIKGATPGLLGYSSRADVVAELADAKAAQGTMLDKIAATPVEEIASDPELLRFAIAGGSSAFKVNCAQCHGSGASGSAGYPNLNDDDWLWGGTIDQIYLTIAHGIRYDGDDDTRYSEMPAFGDMLESDEINQVAAYVVSLSDTPRDPAMVEPGKTIYAENCAACHGDNSEGIMTSARRACRMASGSRDRRKRRLPRRSATPSTAPCQPGSAAWANRQSSSWPSSSTRWAEDSSRAWG